MRDALQQVLSRKEGCACSASAGWSQLKKPPPTDSPTEMVDEVPKNLFHSGTVRLQVDIDCQEQERRFVDPGSYAKQDKAGFIRPAHAVGVPGTFDMKSL
ncbi:MAG: hypothetical protein VX346_18870 [Planctomycetota bacterium]|nr:hypothetical protein [Planctomycetota bacterium]